MKRIQNLWEKLNFVNYAVKLHLISLLRQLPPSLCHLLTSFQNKFAEVKGLLTMEITLLEW